MPTKLEPKSRVRGLVGRNIATLLAASNMRQTDLGARIRATGAADWSQETISRYIKGTRALTLEDLVILAAALQVPLVRLLDGDEPVSVLNATVPVEQVRDVIQYGRVQPEHATGTVLDNLAGDGGWAAAAVADQFVDIIRGPDGPKYGVEEVVRASYEMWRLPPDDVLDRRMLESRKAIGDREPTQRQIRAWRGFHVWSMAHMIDEWLSR